MAKREVKFESQDRRIENILKVLNSYGIKNIEEAEDIFYLFSSHPFTFLRYWGRCMIGTFCHYTHLFYFV